MTDLKRDEDLTRPMVKARPEDTIFQAPYTAPPAPDTAGVDSKVDATADDDTPITYAEYAADKGAGAVSAKPKADEKSPQQKAAETRAKNKRAEERAERKAERDAEAAADESPESAFSRTWTCPQCGRGTTLGQDQQPPTILRCEGCGRDSMGDTWLPPGVGHGEPTLQVGPPR